MDPTWQTWLIILHHPCDLLSMAFGAFKEFNRLHDGFFCKSSFWVMQKCQPNAWCKKIYRHNEKFFLNFQTKYYVCGLIACYTYALVLNLLIKQPTMNLLRFYYTTSRRKKRNWFCDNITVFVYFVSNYIHDRITFYAIISHYPPKKIKLDFWAALIQI